jgi:predicted DNA binding CopG/RHH family protein
MTYNFRGMATRTHLIQVRVSTQERREIKALADARGLSMSAYLRSLAKDMLDPSKSSKPRQ